LEIAFLSTQSTSGAPVRLDEGPVSFLFLLRTGGDVTLQAGSTFVAIDSILDLPVTPQ
jgi:hypothetical protein